MRKKTIVTNNSELFEVNQKIDELCKKYKPGKMPEKEKGILRDLLNRRAKAMSEVLGVEVHSICE